MVPSRIYYAMIAGVMKTIRANNREMAHDYFLKYNYLLELNQIHRLPINHTSDADVASAEQQQADNWEHNQ